ncbi:hypothetical protein BCEP4_1320028 [Burkholderia cepacia]|nr:hypothetical protein BCEP4_1320028 [Burkholderia cepacia]
METTHGNVRRANFARADDGRREEGDLRVVARHRVRVVRLLPGRLARGLHQQELLLRRQPDRRLHLHAARLRGRLRGAAVRRDRVRPPRRPRRAQAHVPRDDRDHGRVDVRGRLPARLRVDRHRRAGDLHRNAAVAGSRARRRVRRRGDLRRRTRAGQSARLLHRVDPDDRHARPVPVAARDPRRAHLHRRGSVRQLGLARAVRRVDPAARGVGVDPDAVERIAGVPAHQGGRQDVEGAADRSVRPVEEPEDRDPRARRPDRRPGRRVVHGPVLRAVLPHADAEGGRGEREHPDRDRAADRHAVLPVLRFAVGQDRPQADHPRGLPDRGTDLLPAVQGAHALREPAARDRHAEGADHGHRRSGGLFVPVQPGGYVEVHELVRHREERARESRPELRERRGTGRRNGRNQGGRHGDPGLRRQGDRRESSGRGVRQDARVDAEGGRLPGQGGPGAAQLADDDRDPDDPRDLRDDGLRPDRRDAGRDVPDADPLHVDVAALSHRQRLVRRVPAGHRVRDRRGEGRHLLGPLVSDRDRAGDVRDRPAVRQGDEGLEHLRSGLRVKGGLSFAGRGFRRPTPRPTARPARAAGNFFRGR